MVTNPKEATWVNPTQATDSSGNVVPWDATTDQAGVEISFDGQPAVSVPLSTGATSLSLKTVAGYTALGAGQHTLSIAEVTKEGVVGLASNTATFLIALVPLAPTNLQLA